MAAEDGEEVGGKAIRAGELLNFIIVISDYPMISIFFSNVYAIFFMVNGFQTKPKKLRTAQYHLGFPFFLKFLDI